MKRTLLGILLLASFNAYGQRAIVAGEVSPGVYENILSSGQALNVNVTGGAISPATPVTSTITTPTVTNASTTILAAAPTRKQLLIQNNHATATIYLNFTTTATTAHLALGPGQSIYMAGIVPVLAVQAIGSVASNTSVVVVQGL